MAGEQQDIQQHITGDYHATSVYGDATVHIYSPPVSSVLPERVWMVPYRRNPFFTGRERLLSALHERFTTARTAVLAQGQAISGLGGIGKTQVAVEYAYRHREDYRFVLWVSATTPLTLATGLGEIADVLQLPGRVLREQSKVVAAVLRWLAVHEGWLLIVDNADELSQVWSWLPTGSTGHVLLTTRDQAVGELESYQVEQMYREEGILLLLLRAQILKPGMALEQVSVADRQVAERIVMAMDGLPLALDQAGAYVEETGCSLSDYWTRYQQQDMVLLRRRGRSGGTCPASVATTWSLSFQRVEQHSSAAADLLRLCAFLASDAIPEELLVEGAKEFGGLLASVAADVFHLNEAIADAFHLDEAIATLRAYSLIAHDPQARTLTIHRLVQAVLRESMPVEEQQLWMLCAVQAVVSAYPESLDFASWSACERLVPHALICATWIEQMPTLMPGAARLLSKTGRYLDDRARYAEAEPLLQRALAIREQQLGATHPSTATSVHNLGALYHMQGRLSEAEPLLQRALTIREQQLGATHPHMAISLHNLGELYRVQGRLSEAEPLLQRALAIDTEAYGAEHPSVAADLNNLGELYRVQGRLSEAEPLLQRALAIRAQQLGMHLYTSQSLNNLAFLYHSQGKYREARSLYERALAICRQVLGSDHPTTQTTWRNYTALLRATGDGDEAKGQAELLRLAEQLRQLLAERVQDHTVVLRIVVGDSNATSMHEDATVVLDVPKEE